MALAKDFKDLNVYQSSLRAAMEIFELSKNWPKHEQYALTAQIPSSSRSIAANVAEAWSKRRFPSHFTSKLSDADAECSETRAWIDFARSCGYLDDRTASDLEVELRRVSGSLVKMMADANAWCGPHVLREPTAPYG